MTIDYFTTSGVLDHNDDSFVAIECSNGSGHVWLGLNGEVAESIIQFECDDFVLCAVSDGVGSSVRGGKASSIVVKELLYTISDVADSDDCGKALRETVTAISDTVIEDLESEGKATLVGYLQFRGRGYVFNTGDSVAEAFAGGRKYRSLEHNVCNATGCPPDSPDARKLTEYIGKKNPRVDVDIIPQCDTAAVYSDGLLMQDILSSELSCRDLAEKSLKEGSEDNITVLVYKSYKP